MLCDVRVITLFQYFGERPFNSLKLSVEFLKINMKNLYASAVLL